MKPISRVLLFVLALSALLISACGTVPTLPVTSVSSVARPSATPDSAAELAFTGVIELIDGTQWTVNAKTITVEASVVNGGPFNIGDTIRIDGVENSDGSFTVTRVGSAAPEDIAGLPQFGADNSNDNNSNDVNTNDGNTNNGNSNDDGGNDNGGNNNSNDD